MSSYWVIWEWARGKFQFFGVRQKIAKAIFWRKRIKIEAVAAPLKQTPSNTI